MSQTADIKAMLDWLASCPLATTLNNGDVVFSIEYLGADTGQMQFEVVQQAANSAFWDEFAEWVEKQSGRRNLPALSDGKKAEKVVCLSPGYIMSQDASSCRFQIQLQLQYYQKGR